MVHDIAAGSTGTWNNFDVEFNWGTVVPTVPNAPGKLFKSAATTSSISLGWTDKSYVEDGVKVYRKLSTSLLWSAVPLATKPANSTSHVDLTPVSGLTYNYRVRAFNATGNSLYSNVITVLAP